VFVRILKKKQYGKQNHFILMKVLGIYISLCMSSNGIVQLAKIIPPFFGIRAVDPRNLVHVKF
jgi:hypothetical protein